MRSVAFALLACVGCVAAPEPSDGERASYTDHFELYGVSPAQAAWYEAFAVEYEAWRGVTVPPTRVFQDTRPICPSPECTNNGRLTVACSAVDGDCMPNLAATLTDHFGVMPLVFRNGMIEVLAGGVGHGDLLDYELDRAVDLPGLVDDETYQTDLASHGSPSWVFTVGYPAADFVRFVVDTLGPASGSRALEVPGDAARWGELGDLAGALEKWRGQPATIGRMYRLPLVECAAANRIGLGASSVPTMVPGILYAPDLAQLVLLGRIAVGNFELAASDQVTISVTSTIHASPFFRVESCGDQDPGRFVASEGTGATVSGRADLPAGRYFVIAGSNGGDAASAERPELVSITTGASP